MAVTLLSVPPLWEIQNPSLLTLTPPPFTGYHIRSRGETHPEKRAAQDLDIARSWLPSLRTRPRVPPLSFGPEDLSDLWDPGDWITYANILVQSHEGPITFDFRVPVPTLPFPHSRPGHRSIRPSSTYASTLRTLLTPTEPNQAVWLPTSCPFAVCGLLALARELPHRFIYPTPLLDGDPLLALLTT